MLLFVQVRLTRMRPYGGFDYFSGWPTKRGCFAQETQGTRHGLNGNNEASLPHSLRKKPHVISDIGSNVENAHPRSYQVVQKTIFGKLMLVVAEYE